MYVCVCVCMFLHNTGATLTKDDTHMTFNLINILWG